MPFAGLMLSTLVVINFIFVIIWILRKRHFAMVSLFVIIACLPQLFKLFATNIGKPKIDKTAKSIKVLSYNVRDFDLYNWSENIHSKEQIFKTIKEQNADIISFQEFYNDTTKTFSTIKQLQALGYKYYYFTKELVLRNTDEWGIAVFSKYPIKEHGEIIKQTFKTSYGKKPFKGLYADIVIADTIVRVVNVHLQSIYFGIQDYETIEEFKATQNVDEFAAKNIFTKLKKAFERRAEQADKLRAFLDAQTKPIILCGDFNDLPNSYVVNTISKNFKDAHINAGFGIGSTYNGKLPFLRIDYLLTSPSFNIQQFKVLYNNTISDHFPIYMECSLKK
ncbi:MAG: hypothetical protein RJA25_1137 [Bacteroidota bacterium]